MMKPSHWSRCLLLFGLVGIVSVCLQSCQKSFDQRLHDEVREFTREKCPMSPEPGTQLDSVTYDMASRIYTLYYSVSEMNEVVMRSNAPLLHYNLLQRLRNDTDFKELKDNGLTFEYVYCSESGHKVFYTTQIRKEEYAGVNE